MAEILGHGTDVASAARRGGTHLLASRWSRTLLQFAATVFLARLLTPNDYGIVAAVVVINGLALVILERGLAAAATQAKELSCEQRTGLFWLNSLVGCFLCVLMFAAAPLVATFYSDDSLTAVTRWLAITFLFNGMAVQLQVELVRSMHFGRLAVAELVAGVASVGATITAAFAGGAYWSLVIGSLTGALAFLIGVAIGSPWRPGRPRQGAGLNALFRFGSGTSATHILNYLSQSVDVIAVGRSAGLAAAGLYSRAYALLLLPLDQITGPMGSVAVPVLSRLQDDHHRYMRTLRTCALLISYTTLPVLALLGGLAPVLITVVYGDRWVAAAPLLSILVIAGAARAYSSLTGWIASSLGMVAEQLKFTICSQIVTISAILLGARWGALGVAIAYAATSVLLVPIGLVWITRATFVDPICLFRACWPAMLLSTILYAQFSIVSWANDWYGLLGTTAIAMGSLIISVGLACALPRFRSDAREIKKHLPLVNRRRAAPSPSTVTDAG